MFIAGEKPLLVLADLDDPGQFRIEWEICLNVNESNVTARPPAERTRYASAGAPTGARVGAHFRPDSVSKEASAIR